MTVGYPDASIQPEGPALPPELLPPAIDHKWVYAP